MDIVMLAKTGEQLLKNYDKMLTIASEVFKALPIGKLDLDDLLKIYSTPMDELIRNNVRKGNKYGAGRFVIEYIDEEYFKLSYHLYFQKYDGSWLDISSSSDRQDIKYLSKTSKMLLSAEKRIEYSIKEPES